MRKQSSIHKVNSLSELNPSQKKAVKCDKNRILVLAGAGSGKTKTLLQKILYLIQEKGVKPEEIMAITFTKNAADEMIDRLLLAYDSDGSYAEMMNDSNLSMAQKRMHRLKKSREIKWISKLTIRTFHSLCYTILKSLGAMQFDNKFKLLTDNANDADGELSKLSAEETQAEVFHKMLIACCEDNDYLLKFKRYVIDYMVDKLHKDTKRFLNDHPDGKYYTSLKGNKIRSKSEQYICDWLYRHNINYVYEPTTLITDFVFKPDFFIPDANLYIEHVSSKSGKMKDKEEQFTSGGKLMVKTYESMTQDTNLFNLALTRIVKGRLPSSYQFDKALMYEEELKGRHKEVKDFLRQGIRILDMIQVDGIDMDTLRKKASQDQHERVRLFYQCTIPIIEKYKAYCTDKSYLDFNDLVINCHDLISSNEEVKNKMHTQYKYVLVDEFQDVNKGQVKLIKTMMNPESQLFCVGDDWQSIYGFRGSNVNYIVNFTKFFKDGELIYLNKNYRSNTSIVKASNEVIKHNKFKIDKEISAFNKSRKKIEVYAGTDHEDTVEFMTKEIKELLSKGIKEDEILVLYRRNKMFEPYRTKFKKEKLNIAGKTIHASKGLESKVVFIIGMTEGSGGFPDVWMEDRIYQLLRPSKHDMLIEEERRLFYVGITRAKEYLYLITELGNESSFLREIPEELKVVYSTPLLQSTINSCDKCGKRVDAHFKFCPYCGNMTLTNKY